MAPRKQPKIAVPVTDDVHWIGAFDPTLRTFDIILKTANGTTYNSYVVRGDHGVVIIDTVKEEFQDDFFERFESVADYDDIRAVILNHLEPDHTGALPELLRRAPQAELIISHQAQSMLKALLKDDIAGVEIRTVTTDDKMTTLGGRHFRFLNTPYLHWPDTQCTFLEDKGILFSGDLFGCHFCDDRLFNDRVGDFRFSFDYYYAHIMRPFKSYVRSALELIEPLALTAIAPAHGPILHDNPLDYVARYGALSSSHVNKELAADEKTLLIFFISAYGSTRAMADEVRYGAEEISNVRVSVYDLEGSEPDALVNLIEEADGIAIGSPTVNGDSVKPVWDILSSLASINTQGKIGAAFGSYGWTGEAVPMIEDRLRGLKFRVPAKGLRIKLIPTDEELDSCRSFGRDIAEHLTGAKAGTVIDFADLA